MTRFQECCNKYKIIFKIWIEFFALLKKVNFFVAKIENYFLLYILQVAGSLKAHWWSFWGLFSVFYAARNRTQVASIECRFQTVWQSSLHIWCLNISEISFHDKVRFGVSCFAMASITFSSLISWCKLIDSCTLGKGFGLVNR